MWKQENTETCKNILHYLTNAKIYFEIYKHTKTDERPINIRVVLLKALGFPIRYILAVMPARTTINYSKLSKLISINRRHLLLASESEVKHLIGTSPQLIHPFILNEHIHLMIDNDIFKYNEKIIFYPGQCNIAVAINIRDYQKLVAHSAYFCDSFSNKITENMNAS